ncbi:MAG: ribonuclease III [Clostridia bacterium]|nr:ribonuclease III [Clostridia bacterium]MDR3645340.1 ribonuclease III [Clostridia bacterium]
MTEALEKTIGYTFRNKRMLENALTHSSFANESRDKSIGSNERLEFLGDAVLGLLTAEYLYSRLASVPEGELTKLRATMVCEKSLHGFALQIGLGEYLRLGRGEENTKGRERPSILADAFEALVAAIYVDGGLEPACRFVGGFADSFFSAKIEYLVDDYKTALQEIIQKNPGERLEYALVSESGPDHDKLFVVEVHLNSNVIGEGRGKSKKEAEQMAAKEALKLMGQ